MIHRLQPGLVSRAIAVTLCPYLLALGSSPAIAQDTTPPPATSGSQPSSSSNEPQEVIVTGSRIQRSTFNTPNPVTVLNSKDIQNLGITNVGDVLNELPQNSPFFAANNVGLGNFNVGAELANLRGLNPFFGTRTLTMVDTERVVPQATGGGVDVTLIPSMLVDRTEVVTGGASAVYGSDAVAGVVNIILDKKLNGLKFQADYGQTEYGDGGDTHFSLGFGHALGERAHFIVGAEYENHEDIGLCSQVRSWCQQGYAVFTNTGFGATSTAPNGNGLPHYIIGPGAMTPNVSQTGVLIPCAAPGPVCASQQQYIFNAAGTSATAFNPGTYADGGTAQGGGGGAGTGVYDGTTIRPEVKRYTGLAHLDYAVTDHLNAFLQVSYARSDSINPYANGAIGPEGLEIGAGMFVPFNPSTTPIMPDNAYLPAQFKAGGANALGPGGALLGFNLNAIDPARNETTDDTVRLTGGLSGDISGSWGWDSYFEYGVNNNNQALYNNVVTNLLGYALDAVTDPSTGSIVCRTSLPGAPVNAAAAGCQPLDLFGANTASSQGLAYAFRTLREYSTLKEYVLSGNVHGDVFSGVGAGPFKVSAGAEARRDTADVTHDLADQPYYDHYFLSYGLDYAGRIDVLEGYTELNAPLLKDLPFAKYLELDAAYRYTNNTNKDQTANSATEGESVTNNIDSWKVSAIWDLNSWFRLRGTRSLDVRAAGFRELYESYVVESGGAFGSITDPFNGPPGKPVPAEAVTALTGGNIHLTPEKADTTTVGFVIAPKEGPLQRFQFSTDWYQIIIHDPITGPPFGLGVQNIVNLCNEGNQAFCDRIVFGPSDQGGTKKVVEVDNTALNLGSYEIRGVDFEADYSLPMQNISSSLPGDLSFRLLTSLLYDMTVDAGLGAPPVDYAGQSGPTNAFGGFNTSPRWQSNLFMTYATGPLTTTLQVRYIGHGTFETLSAYGGEAIAPGAAGYSSTNPNSINNNSVPSVTYLNLSADYNVNQNIQVFVAIDNLLNKDPPIAPGGNGYPTNPVYFDTYGLTWKLGVRAQF